MTRSRFSSKDDPLAGITISEEAPTPEEEAPSATMATRPPVSAAISPLPTPQRAPSVRATTRRRRVHFTISESLIEFVEDQYRTLRRPDGKRFASASDYVEFLIMLARERP